MQLYNLRFGVATTPRQVEAYQQLFPTVDRLRDEILTGLGAEAVAAAEAMSAEAPAEATEVFAELPWEWIEGKPAIEARRRSDLRRPRREPDRPARRGPQFRVGAPGAWR